MLVILIIYANLLKQSEKRYEMDYVEIGKIPPKSKSYLSEPSNLAERLCGLIGTEFILTGKPRTDGSNFRKLVTEYLLKTYTPEASVDFQIVPPKKKGVPSFLREYIDTYIVTTGASYNLQVWNRNPNSKSVQVDLRNGEVLLASDVRFVLGKINSNNIIESIIIMTPEYLEQKFGNFGKPTIKQQMIISEKKREEIIRKWSLVVDDISLPSGAIDVTCEKISDTASIKDDPEKVYPISYIDKRITDTLVGQKLDISLSTKQRGQQLERLVAYQLGYKQMQDMLDGGYPDIRNQMLEVKVQDSPTIDLGKYSPQFEEEIHSNFTTRTVRYLIALTDALNGTIDGIVLVPGEELGRNFTYVSDKSFKCQRSIPMSFFDKFIGQSVYNP